MTDLRTAAQQVLEALEGGADSWQLVGPAIDALKAALAEPKAPASDDPHRDHWVAIAETSQRIAASKECGPAEAASFCAAIERLSAALEKSDERAAAAEPEQDPGFWGRVAARQASLITQLEATGQQALEALEMHVPQYLKDRGYRPITALRAALAEPVQEPATMPGPGLVMCPACCSQFDPALNRVEPVQEPDNGGKTGWPPGLLQDDCRGLSKWLASRPDARQRLREALAEPAQEPVGVVTSMVKGGVTWYRWPSDMPDGTPLYANPPQRPAEPVQEPVAWLRVIDEAMVTHHLGVADPADDYETAMRKLNILLCCAQDNGTYFAKQAEPVQEPVQEPE